MAKIEMKQVGRNLNVKIGKLLITKTAEKEELAVIKKNISKFNTLKDQKNSIATRLKEKIVAQLQKKIKAQEEEITNNKTKLKAEKSLIKKTVTKVEITQSKKTPTKDNIATIKIDKKEFEMIEKEIDKAISNGRDLMKYKGHKHSVTGKVWNGEKYV